MHDPPVFWGGKRRRHWWIGATIQQTKLNRASFVSRTGCNFSRSCELGNAGIFSRINDRGRDLTSRYLPLRSFLLQFIRRSPFFSQQLNGNRLTNYMYIYIYIYLVSIGKIFIHRSQTPPHLRILQVSKAERIIITFNRKEDTKDFQISCAFPFD